MKITFDPSTNTQSTVIDKRWIQNSSTNMVYLYGVDSGWIIRATFTRSDKFKIANMIGVYDLDPDDEYCYVIPVPTEAAAVPGGLGVSLILYEPIGEDYIQHATIATAGYLYDNDSVVAPIGMDDEIQIALELAISNLATNKIEASAIVGGVGETIDKDTPIYSKIKADSVFETKADADSHKSDTSNPHEVTKTQVGLANADNTSDVDKPVSAAQQTELDKKANKSGGNTFAGEQVFSDKVTISEEIVVPTPVADGNATTKQYTDGKISTDIGTHNNDSGAHEFLLGLLGYLDQEVARLDGRGRSYGEIDYLTATLVAMETAARNTTINAAVVSGFGGVDYTPSSGDLVYDTGVGTGVNYHEWEYNGTNWVDNGAISSPKANSTTYGTVNGTGGYVTIAAGVITVILAQNATYLKKAGTTDKYTYENIFSALADRYTKSQQDAMLESIKFIQSIETETLGIVTNGQAMPDPTGYDFILLSFRHNVDEDPDELATQFVNVSEFLAMETSYNLVCAPSGETATINIEEVTFSDPTNSQLTIYGIKLVDTLHNEVRSVGEEMITYRADGLVEKIESDTVMVIPTYDVSGNLTKLTEEYVLDGKTFETTFEYDMFGRIVSTNKTEVV
ncbi:MAG: hypothetical protein PHW40_05110 [Candidatus Izemoplasmatales bacterium]|nr:hypothetical protein [Candidatus Izemoplasmatales bacterium]